MPKPRKRRPRQAEIDKRIGAVIRACRKDANLSMEHVSRESGIPFATYQRYETGASAIPVADIMLVSGVIGTTTHDIVGHALGYEERGTMPSSEHIRLIRRIETMPIPMVKQLDGLIDMMGKKIDG